jgi:ribose transport system substrate-binding protein
LEGIRKGIVAGAIVQQPYEWGYQGMKDMAKWIEGDKSFVPADGLIIVPTQIIDKSNVEGFIQQVKTWRGH